MKVKTLEEKNLLGNDGIIGEINVKKKHDISEISKIPGTVSMYSVYENVAIGTNCETLYNSVVDSCKENKHTNFTKLAIYTAVGKNFGSRCLQTIARECNSRLKDALNGCITGFRPIVNFLSADFPNFPGNSIFKKNIVNYFSISFCFYSRSRKIDKC